MMSYMIEAKGLSKRFGEHLAVDGVSFNINPSVIDPSLEATGQ